MGELIENFVYITLKSKYEKEYIHFYRTNIGSEIDFILEDKENQLSICEVKYRNKVNLPVVMKNFSKKYNNINRKLIITKNILKKEEDVYYIPAVVLPFIDLD
jgi:predicted AAA+ superfamily ATPase